MTGERARHGLSLTVVEASAPAADGGGLVSDRGAAMALWAPHRRWPGASPIDGGGGIAVWKIGDVY